MVWPVSSCLTLRRFIAGVEQGDYFCTSTHLPTTGNEQTDNTEKRHWFFTWTLYQRENTLAELNNNVVNRKLSNQIIDSFFVRSQTMGSQGERSAQLRKNHHSQIVADISLY